MSSTAPTPDQRSACDKVSTAVTLLEEAQADLVNDPGNKNAKVIHLLRFIGTQLAKRLDPIGASHLPPVYPWERSPDIS